MGLIYDTGYFIAADRARSRRVAPIDMNREEAGLSAIALSELYVGAYRADTPLRRQVREKFIQEVLREFKVFDFNARIASIHARLRTDLMIAGQLIGAHDLIIAATALHLGWPIMTGNRKEFGRIPGLTVLKPPAP